MNKQKIALLVDYENFNEDRYFPILKEELRAYGEIIIARAYSSVLDNSKLNNSNEDSKLNDKLKRHGLDPVFQLSYSKNKNAVDIRIAIEAVELLQRGYIDIICLATNDSDFTPLVKKLRENNKLVIGSGKDLVSQDYKDACDHFINVQKIFEAKEILNEKKTSEASKKRKAEKERRLKKLVNQINDIIDQNKDTDEYVDLSVIFNNLYSSNKEFSPKNYGAPSTKALPFFKDFLGNYFDILYNESNNNYKIKKKQ